MSEAGDASGARLTCRGGLILVCGPQHGLGGGEGHAPKRLVERQIREADVLVAQLHFGPTDFPQEKHDRLADQPSPGVAEEVHDLVPEAGDEGCVGDPGFFPQLAVRVQQFAMPALVGGGLKVRPGEISLAHLGVLFLDELPEFQRQVLDSLRQPLETGNVSVARANTHVTFPARVQLVAAMNPCRCGHLSDPSLACSRAPRCAADYQARVSGPLLDRIDLHVDVQAVSAADLTLPPPAEGSREVADRVARARSLQSKRYNGSGVRTNAEADGAVLDEVATPDEPGRKLLADAAAAMRLSARGFHRVLRVARTIADLAGAEKVGRIHVAEALSYRRQAPRN